MNFFRKKNVDSVINLLIFEAKKLWGHHINAVWTAHYVSTLNSIFCVFSTVRGTSTHFVKTSSAINYYQMLILIGL